MLLHYCLSITGCQYANAVTIIEAEGSNTARLLLEKLKPEDGDAIVIGSDMEDERRAELAAKSAALTTIMAHERHHLI